MIDNQEEYKVEQVISHWYHGHKKPLQYLIQWKGYSVTDNTWEPADQVFADTFVKAYYRKHPLEEGRTKTFTTHLCAALAKSHWLPHNPLMNFGVTGPTTKQDYTGVPKISALMVPTASGTMKNTSTCTHCAVTQPTKPIAEANTSEKSALKKSIHKALVKSFTCLPHTPPCSPIVPTTGWITVACCNAPLNNLRPLATTTATSTHGQSVSMAGDASSSPKAFPTFTPVSVVLLMLSITPGVRIGHSPWPWRASSTVPSRWSRPSPSSVMVQLPAKQEDDVTAWLAHVPENCRDMQGNPMMGSGRLPEGGLESVSLRIEAGEPLEGRSNGNDEVSMSHECSRQDLDYLAHQPVLA